MTVVVITGGTRGLGRGLTEAFLKRGASVVFSGKSESTVREAEAAWAGQHPGRVLGVASDVTRLADVEALWDAGQARFGRVDVWINNAGTSNVQKDFASLPASDVASVVGTNLIGAMHGAHVALNRMKAAGHGHLFMMEGYGSDGSVQPGMALYGATKHAIRYFTRSLVVETRGGPVKVGSLSPGIVVTDLLVEVYRDGDPANWKRQRWLFELIADRVEDVAPWLADRVLAGPAHGEHVAWMTVPKAIFRAFLPRYYRRNLFGSTLSLTRGSQR